MKRNLPMVFKYLAIVAVSCLLAVGISNRLAAAQEPESSPRIAIIGENSVYAMSGKYKVESSLAVWRDGTRARDVPVKLYYPTVNGTAATPNEFPVILFSHGLGGSREGGARWATHWASHGFVVVAIQHMGSDEALWKGVAPAEIANRMKAGMTVANFASRVGDVHFVIDEVIRRAASDEKAFAKADPTRIGMSGHSFGAQTTFAVVGQKPALTNQKSGLDPRIAAAIAFSPNARNKSNLRSQFGDIKLPVFSITGSADGSILDDGTLPEHRRLPFENMATGQKYLVVFNEGDHMVFGGHALSTRRPETARDKKIQIDVMSGTLAFWNAMLKHDASARRWLERGGFKGTIGDADIFDQK